MRAGVIKDLLKNIPTVIKTLRDPDPFRDVSGYESPDEEFDLVADTRENAKFLAARALHGRSIGGGLLSMLGGMFRKRGGRALTRFLFGSLRCHGCHRKIQVGSTYSRCFDCDTFALCPRCEDHEDRLGHAHQNTNYVIRVTGADEDVFQRVTSSATNSHELIIGFLDAYAERPFLGRMIRNADDGSMRPRWWTYGEIRDRMIQISNGLMSEEGPCRLSHGDVVGICCSSRMEYLVVDFACARSGLTFVPIQRVSKPEAKRHVVAHSEMRCVFVEAPYVLEFAQLVEEIDSLKMLVVIEKDDFDQPEPDETEEEEEGERVEVEPTEDARSFLRLAQFGTDHTVDPTPFQADEIATILYTSGSTGPPKGVVYTERAWRRELSHEPVPPFAFPLISVNFVPFSHYTGRSITNRLFCNGGRVGIIQRSEGIIKETAAFRPTLFVCVPRLLQLIRRKYQRTVQEEILLRQEEEPISGEALSQLKGEVFNRPEFRHALGDRLCLLSCFGAPLSMKLKTFIRRILMVPLFDAYGGTEFGAATLNYRRIKGEAGLIRLEDVPELGYFSTDKPYPRGELLVKRKEGVLGYHRDAAATEALFDEEGYCHTGDIAELRGDRFVIIDRTSNVVKLSQGEFVCFEEIEKVIEESVFVDDVIVYSNRLSANVAAVVVVASGERDEKAILADIRRLGTEAHLQPYEIPVGIVVADEPFTAENGSLTETGKKRRRRVWERYGKRLDDRLNANDMTSLLEDLFAPEEGEGLGAEMLDKTFAELGGDSMAAVMFIQEMEKRDRVVDFASLMTMTIGEILNDSPSRSDVPEQDILVVQIDDKLEEMRELIGSLRENSSEDEEISPIPTSKPGPTIFLTGSSGFLGKKLLVELLRVYPSGTVLCLVRSSSVERMRSSLDPSCLDRVSIIEGDLSRPLFGLPDDRFADISSRIDFVLHNGAMVNHLLSYSDLYDVNTRSIFDIVRLCGGHKPIFFVSSVAAYLGGSRSVPIEEVEHSPLYGYASTKWAADVLLEKCYPSHVTFRPALIGWTSQGELNESDWVCILLRAMLEHRLVPKEEDGSSIQFPAVLDMVPVSFVARHVVAATKIPFEEMKGRSFVLSMKHVGFSDLIRCAEQVLDCEFERCRFEELAERLKENRRVTSFVRFLQLNPIVMDLLGKEEEIGMSEETLAVIDDEEYVQRMMEDEFQLEATRNAIRVLLEKISSEEDEEMAA